MIKKLGFTILALLLMAGVSPAATLTVTVSNAESDQGCASVAVYNIATMQNFGSGSGYFQGKHADISQGTARAVFSNIPEGMYAVAAFHDVDCNGAIKKNFWGIPQEMYGFSNNYGKRPDFNSASFMVSGDTQIAIRLQWY